MLAYHSAPRWFPGGYIGVDLFFVLSGFLIATLLLDELGKSGLIARRAFYRRRILRLVPALAALLVFYAVLSAVRGDRLALASIPIAGLYLTDFVQSLRPSIGMALGHTWSLAIEEQFYLLLPLALLATRRWTAQRRLRATIVGILLVATWRAALWRHGVPWERVYYGLDTRADALLVGVLLAQLCRLPRFAPRSTGRPQIVIGVTIFIAWMVTVPPTSGIGFLGGFTLVAVAAGLLIHGSVPIAEGFLVSRALAWMGRLSYALYLWHSVIFNLLGVEAHRERVPIGLALSLATAALSYRFVEMPFLRRKQRSTDHVAAEIMPEPAVA